MNSNFGFNNGMTIQIPAFNAANDQLFLAIKNYFDIRFNELNEQIQQIKSKSEKLMISSKKIESEINNLKINHLKELNGKRKKFKMHFNGNVRFKRCASRQQKIINNHKENESENRKTESENNKNEITLKSESFDRNMEHNEILETNSFLIGINNKNIIENETKTNVDQSQKSCELAFDNIIEKYLKVNDTKLVFKDILEPVVILNPLEKKEIFVGGNENVRLPLWAYKKCLTCIRGKPNELNSRLCLRLLQAKFGRKYMLSHNYNGSGDKVPIDRQIMSSILVQAKMQFPDQEDFQTNTARFAMFRDYINNAFRVVAYRHRKGIQSNTPFWDQNGEPITDLDPPSWIVDHIN